MSPNFILVEFGIPNVVKELEPFPRLNHLALLHKTWLKCHAFDGVSRFRLVAGQTPDLTLFQKILAHTIYNPVIDVKVEWERCGDYAKSDVISLISQGLEHDDDIIQQWFDADEVIRLLEAADDWEQLKLAVNCVRGGHEGDSAERSYAKHVLGNDFGDR